METAEEYLLTPDYWAESRPDLRLNPQVAFDDSGLATVLETSDKLRSHVIFATSGSSGSPKLVCISKAGLFASAKAVNSHLAVTADDRWLCALPTFHVGGFGIWVRAYAAQGKAFRFDGKWDAEQFTQSCQNLEITLTSLVSAQVFDLVKARVRAPKGLRAVVVGGSALSEELSTQARDLGWPVLQSFGMTESSSQIATQPLGSRPSPQQNSDLPILPCWEARANEEGLLQIRGAPLFSYYLHNSSGSWEFDAPHDDDGWFTAQDRVTIANDTLTPLGRDGRVVKILGELVNLDRLEAMLAKESGEISTLVTLETLPDPRSGERLVLVAEATISPARLEELQNRFNRKVAPFEQILEIKLIEKLPKSPLGKIQRAQLKRLIEG